MALEKQDLNFQKLKMEYHQFLAKYFHSRMKIAEIMHSFGTDKDGIQWVFDFGARDTPKVFAHLDEQLKGKVDSIKLRSLKTCVRSLNKNYLAIRGVRKKLSRYGDK